VSRERDKKNLEYRKGCSVPELSWGRKGLWDWRTERSVDLSWSGRVDRNSRILCDISFKSDSNLSNSSESESSELRNASWVSDISGAILRFKYSSSVLCSSWTITTQKRCFLVRDGLQ